jgi:hypothetical protein
MNTNIEVFRFILAWVYSGIFVKKAEGIKLQNMLTMKYNKQIFVKI